MENDKGLRYKVFRKARTEYQELAQTDSESDDEVIGIETPSIKNFRSEFTHGQDFTLESLDGQTAYVRYKLNTTELQEHLGVKYLDFYIEIPESPLALYRIMPTNREILELKVQDDKHNVIMWIIQGETVNDSLSNVISLASSIPPGTSLYSLIVRIEMQILSIIPTSNESSEILC